MFEILENTPPVTLRFELAEGLAPPQVGTEWDSRSYGHRDALAQRIVILQDLLSDEEDGAPI
jgi:hypothetical protein